MPVMVPVFLVRHASHRELGKVLSGRSEIELDAGGRDQVDRLAARFATLSLAAVHSSPRRRTMDTAAGIARASGLRVTPVPALDEVDFGAWAGRSFADLSNDPLWDRWNGARDVAVPPGGESMALATARAFDHLVAAAASASGPIAVVSHGDIIRGVIAQCLGLPLGRMLSFDVHPASVSEVSIGAHECRVVSVNERVA